MRYGKIAGTGSALPPMRLSNDQLPKSLDTSDEWIKSRTGIASRCISGAGTIEKEAVEAALRAMDVAGCAGEMPDVIIAATMSEPIRMPSLACRIQEALAKKKASVRDGIRPYTAGHTAGLPQEEGKDRGGMIAFDLNGACTGFVHGLMIAQSMIASGAARTALVVGAECLSQAVDWSDRSTCVLFGDGAGAVLLQEDPAAEFCCIGQTFGDMGQLLTYGPAPLQMDGRGVFAFAVRHIPRLLHSLLARCDLSAEQIDHFLLHQANRRLLEAVARHMGVPDFCFPSNVSEVGNTSAASIPILLDQMVKSGRIRAGDRIVFVGFGGGMSAAAAYMRWL